MSTPTPARADWPQVKALFDAALALPPAARRDYLLAASADVALRGEVVSLLAHADAAEGEGALEPRSAETPMVDPAPQAMQGQRLGPWTLTGVLGQGGMGEVHRSRRADGAYDGEAAIKILKRGMDSAALLARFAQEQRSLARLNHPHIARLFDAGLTPDHRPYFVMELVEGQPIDLAAQGLSIEAKLALFLQLADAVAHAHRQLLVHRDLKPSNVLVDRAGQVKLLDFGIAKALDPLEGEAGEATLAGERPFTPHYASPEQVRGEPVGTATDVYSLGVLLYQGLTGVRPTGRGATTAAEAVRCVLEEAPMRPSRLPAAEAPGLQGAATRHKFEGDLDHVLLKALEKPIEHRYASVDALAADIRAFLDGRPISARAAGLVYVLGKFLRRHRWSVLAGVVGGTGLLAGLAATLMQARFAAAFGVIGLAGGLGLALFLGRKAELAKMRAEQHVADLRRLVREVVVEYGDAITHVPGGHERKATMLASTAEYLDRLMRSGTVEPGLSGELGTLHARIAKLRSGHEFNAATDLSSAEQHALRAGELLAAAAREGGLDAAHVVCWSEALGVMAEVHQQKEQLGQALTVLQQADTLLKDGLTRHPGLESLQRAQADVQMRMVELHYGWGKPHLNQPDAAQAAIDRAIAYYEVGRRGTGEGAVYDLSQLGTAFGARAMIHARHERWDDALAAARVGCAHRVRASELEPHNQMLKGAAASELNLVGGLHLNVGDAAGALGPTTRAWALVEALLAADPGHETWTRQKGWLAFNHGRALLGVGRAMEARAVLQVSADWLVAQAVAGAATTAKRRRLALTRLALARAARVEDPRAHADALTTALDAVGELQALVDVDAHDRDSWMALGECACTLAAWQPEAQGARAWKERAAQAYATAEAERPLTAEHARHAAWAQA